MGYVVWWFSDPAQWFVVYAAFVIRRCT